MLEAFLTTTTGRLSVGLLAGAFTVLWTLAIYGQHTNILLALAAGGAVGWLAATSRVPVHVRLASFVGFLLLLLFWELLGRLIIPR